MIFVRDPLFLPLPSSSQGPYQPKENGPWLGTWAPGHLGGTWTPGYWVAGLSPIALSTLPQRLAPAATPPEVLRSPLHLTYHTTPYQAQGDAWYSYLLPSLRNSHSPYGRVARGFFFFLSLSLVLRTP